jgi:hypothetical protein
LSWHLCLSVTDCAMPLIHMEIPRNEPTDRR